MANNTPTQPAQPTEPAEPTQPAHGTMAWKARLNDFEQMYLMTLDKPNNWFQFDWPNPTDPDVRKNCHGNACHPAYAGKGLQFKDDGGWWVEGARHTAAQILEMKQRYVYKNDLTPDLPGYAPRNYSDNQRILSFWVTGMGLDDPEPRTLDLDGTNPDSKIQLKALIAIKMYLKRKEWDTSDYAGKNVTREEIGLPKPASVPANTPPEEVEKIEKLLDSLKDGVPEMKILGSNQGVPKKPTDAKLWRDFLRWASSDP